LASPVSDSSVNPSALGRRSPLMGDTGAGTAESSHEPGTHRNIGVNPQVSLW